MNKSRKGEAKNECKLGINLIKQKRYDEAIPHFEKAIELDAACGDAYKKLAWIYLDKEEFEKAEELLHKALKTLDDVGSTIQNLFNLHLRRNDFQSAYSLAESYWGRGCQSCHEATNYDAKSRNCPYLQYMIGLCYTEGKMTERNDEEAFAWYAGIAAGSVKIG